MEKERPMTILLLEDEEIEVNKFKEFVNTRNDVKLVKTTNSSKDAIEAAKTYIPEGIIVDLELHKGEGSGLEFLEKLQKIKLDFKPLIVITTNVVSEIIYNHVRKFGADFIFYKKQSDYSVETVINSMISLRETLNAYKTNYLNSGTTIETPNDQRERISEKIKNELDLIGVSNHLKGRKYLYDAIFYLIEHHKENESVFTFLASKYKIGISSVSRAMQTAINYAWRISPVEDLMLHYKARINYETGVPTPTEFIYYYSDKIRKFL